MTTYAIIPSGGIGKRITSSLPKQYVKIKGKELIAYTLEIFQKSDLIDKIIIAAQPQYFSLLEKIKEKFNISKLSKIVEGGVERQASVYNALLATNAKDDDIIVVHDAARPLLSQNILNRALIEAKSFDNIIVAIKATDTLVSGDTFVQDYLNRNSTYLVQTPQISRYRILTDAMESANKMNFLGTDESILLYKASHKIKIVEGSSKNFKITTDEDLDLFKIICDIK
ncbi:MAG: 2-C-methyl-D-erythritol 4-phosphate cytidylyltransferase [Bacteroidetes bacterium]|nr:2-C-methyl-D-erythritol 4-phosphate cytidylyltransferase [Bacteroidota bacterium]MBU1114836.1 2-C-methyl-D-erythritol 4-phosphate cytidylyltransferase [Bacteroidota bacterium]MBU1799983.1 2-C-methyl-D-erythritol 4-phosphate cytidylyltransferase [Bacteroidota bacterium]